MNGGGSGVQAWRAQELEGQLARYRAVGDLEHVAHVVKENARLAAYEGQYRALLQSFDHEVAAAAAAAEEASAERGRRAARLEMQVCCSQAPASAGCVPRLSALASVCLECVLIAWVCD